MFEGILRDNGLFKPISEEKLYDKLTEAEKAIVEPRMMLGLKFAVLTIIDNIPDDLSLIKCSHCGNFISLATYKKGNLPATCSKSCGAYVYKQRRYNTMIERFGSIESKNEYVKEKQRKNAVEKYGMPFQATKEFRSKVKNTLIERHGVDHNSKMDSVKESRYVEVDGKKVHVMHTETAIANRSQAYSSFSNEKRAKIGRSISNGIKSHYSYIDRSVLNDTSGHSITSLMEAANCSPMTAYRALVNNGDLSKSYTESEIASYINSLGIETVSNTRKIIAPKELDIYVPSHKLAIEYDGLYWHSSNSKELDKTAKVAHIFKTVECEKQGINLLHIFENEWLHPVKRTIWKSIISHKLGKSKRVYARKCELKTIDAKTAFEFCEKNHLQGGIYGSIYLGLFYGSELIQVAILGKPRYSKADLELLRLCSKTFTCVVGGASKITKGLKFISYGNRRWCSTLNNVYDTIGTYKGISDPCYFYFESGELKHRSGFMKHKLEGKLKSFDPSKSEVENCYANGLRRIWDCGNVIYEV